MAEENKEYRNLSANMVRDVHAYNDQREIPESKIP
jgi:hypothetical protein